MARKPAYEELEDRIKELEKETAMYNRVEEHFEAEFSHSICPECAKKLYPELQDDKE